MLALAAFGCAAGGAKMDARLAEGRRSYAQGDWRRSFEAFGEVQMQTCYLGKPDARCDEAVAGKAEAQVRLGEPREAYWFVQRLVWFRGRTAGARLQAIEKEAQQAFASRLVRRPGQATLRIAFETNTKDSFTPRKVEVTVDLVPIPLIGLDDAKQGPVRASTATAAISPGEHELEALVKYESGGRLPPDCFIFVDHKRRFDVADGDTLEIDVRFKELATWSSSAEAIDVTAEVRPAPRAK